MTQQEKLIVSAYTGFIMVDFDEYQSYIERLLDRTVYTHEFAFQRLQDEIKEKVKEDFLRLCREETPNTSGDIYPF